MEFSRQEYWNGLPFPSPADLPDPGVEPRSPAFQVESLPSEPPGKHKWTIDVSNFHQFFFFPPFMLCFWIQIFPGFSKGSHNTFSCASFDIFSLCFSFIALTLLMRNDWLLYRMCPKLSLFDVSSRSEWNYKHLSKHTIEVMCCLSHFIQSGGTMLMFYYWWY